MIKPVQSSVSFAADISSKISPAERKFVSKVSDATVPVMQNNSKNKIGVFGRAINFIKRFNKVKNTTQGFIKGVANGFVYAGVIGMLGRNIKRANRDIFKTAKGIISDSGKIVKHIITKSTVNILKKSPIENFKSLKSLPGLYYDKCLKKNKLTGIIAGAAFVASVAANTIIGKFRANRANSNVDHSLGMSHK